MNSLKKVKGVPILNFEGEPGVPLLNFGGGPEVPLLNFRAVSGPTFEFWGGLGPRSWGLEVPGPGVLFPLLHHAKIPSKYLRSFHLPNDTQVIPIEVNLK